MRKLLNTLYVTNENIYMTLDGENVVCKENNEVNYYWVKDPNSKPSLYRRGTYNSLVL